MPLESKTIVVATNNDNKIKEIREILPEFNIKKAKDIIDNFYVEEDGIGFCENAYLKAKALSKYTNEIVLADDSGLEVFSLNNQPGIYSSRYSKEATDESNLNKLLRNMENITDRSARFVCCVVVIFGETVIQEEGFVYGTIEEKKKGINGFGYDPVFTPANHNRTFAEMEQDLKNSISHRHNALNKIKRALKERGLI